MVLNLISNSDHKEACQEINHDVFNLMTSLTYLNSDWTLQHKLNKEASKLLSTNGELKHKLFKTPILCVTPIFSQMSDWETLFNGDTNKLSQSFSLAPSNISELVRLDIRHHNKNYLNHIIHAAKTSPLAMLEIGVTPEIIKLLREVKIEQKNNALRFKLPLFQWRFTDLELSLDGGKEFSEVDWLHYLIQSTPVSLKNLSPKSDLSKTYHVEYAYPLVEHLVRFNMRATIIRTLLPNYHEAKIRDLYKRLLSVSSSCGKLPSSFTWYFSVERRRTHSSFYLLLYRLAQRSGLEHIHSIIAAYSWYLALAPEDPMSINRLAILVATAQSGSGTVYVSACRSCTANYLLCNTDEKKEFAHSFHCEPCRKKRQLAAA